MNIALIVAIFPPEREPAAIMAGELASAWRQEGHEVTVICPTPNRPSADKPYPGYARRLRDRRIERGVEVVRVWTWMLGTERRAINRVLENVSFGISSALSLALARKPDVIVVETWPILAYIPVGIVARLRGVPFVNYVQDIYPEAAISGGQLKDKSLAARVLKRLDRLVCSQASRNIAVGESMKRLLVSQRNLPESRFVVIENWLDLTRIRPVKAPRWREEVGIAADEFVCMFAGTMGYASGVDVLVEVADRLRDVPRLRLVCVGEGVLKQKMLQAARARKLSNLLLLPFQPRELVADMQSSADVMLLTTASGMGNSSVPSKFITYLAVGKPVICSASADSDLARVVLEERLGAVTPPNCPEELANEILNLRGRTPGELAEMGNRARSVALARYSLSAALRGFARLFQELSPAGYQPRAEAHGARH